MSEAEIRAVDSLLEKMWACDVDVRPSNLQRVTSDQFEWLICTTWFWFLLVSSARFVRNAKMQLLFFLCQGPAKNQP